MYQFFGSLDDQVALVIDTLCAKEHRGPQCPKGDWQSFSIKQKEIYFVYLRNALDYVKRDPVISEEAIEFLFNRYLEVFKDLVNIEGSKLQIAVQNGVHAYFMGSNPEIKAIYDSLITKSN